MVTVMSASDKDFICIVPKGSVACWVAKADRVRLDSSKQTDVIDARIFLNRGFIVILLFIFIYNL